MDNFPNSRKLNGISLVECLENKVTGKLIFKERNDEEEEERQI